MNCLIYAFYVFLVGLIRIYKWIEYRILLCFTWRLKRIALQYAESIGVVLHLPGEPDYKPGLDSDSREECRLVIEKTGGKYDKLIHINIKDIRVFARCGNTGTVGMGEAFMDGSWDCYDENWEDVTQFAKRMLENNFLDVYYNWWNKFLERIELYTFNLQTRERAFRVAGHYNLGDDLYEAILGQWMQYTCGYWKSATDLNQAQLDKLDLIARKLDLKPGMRVLDLGCGWGNLCKYLAEKYQVSCVGVTISKDGAAYGERICKGLPVEFRVADYRSINEKFDRVVSIGLMEHVGRWNYRELMKVAARCLDDDGVFLLHSCGRNHYKFHQRSDPWITKHLFPNCEIPDPGDIAETTKNIFVIEDWHNIANDYPPTLAAWRDNFVKGWPQIQHNYPEKQFYRLWILYFTWARGLYLSRRIQLWQIVFSKNGLKRDYRAAR